MLPDARSVPSTGLAAIRFLRQLHPGVPITLLGFDSHAEQPQSAGTTDGKTMVHDFHSEREEIAQMQSVERCAVSV